MNKMKRISKNFLKHTEATEHLEDALSIEDEVCEKVTKRGAGIFSSRIIVCEKYYLVEVVVRSKKDLPI